MTMLPFGCLLNCPRPSEADALQLGFSELAMSRRGF
jgi:hypothetical protein